MKKLKLKDRINNVQQTLGESISATWERFKKYLRSVPDHRITEDSLHKIFYGALDDNGKAMADTIIRGSFMDYTYVETAQRLEKVAKTNRAWGTRDSKTTRSSFSIGTNPKQVKLNQEVFQEPARININIGLLMKQKQERVNLVSYQGSAPGYDDYNYEEDACYVNEQMEGFRTNDLGSHRIIGTKVKEIKVETITETTTPTGVSTMLGTEPKTEMVSGCEKTTTRTRGVVSTFHPKIVMMGKEVQRLKRC